MDPTTLVAVAAATVASLLGSLIVAVAGWMEARRGERHAINRALIAERSERAEVAVAERRLARIMGAVEFVRESAREVGQSPMARHVDGWGTLKRASRLLDEAMDDTEDDTAETVAGGRDGRF